VSNKKRYSETPVYEFRIKYITKNALVPSYHYYMAESAEQALDFQLEMAKHKKWEFEILKIEKFCKYANNWQDESDVITDENRYITKDMHDE
jgi:hypothetical protein